MRATVKLAEDKYVEWSTVVDAPITWVLNEPDMLAWLHDEYGLDMAIAKMNKANTTGSSSTSLTLEDIEAYNRAGENCESFTPTGDDSQMTLEQILYFYSKTDETK